MKQCKNCGASDPRFIKEKKVLAGLSRLYKCINCGAVFSDLTVPEPEIKHPTNQMGMFGVTPTRETPPAPVKPPIMGLYDYIKRGLEKVPELRDSDQMLMAHIWSAECRKHQVNSLPEFFVRLSSGKMTNYESVGRARRKVQEDHPELRGKNYKDRQDNQESVKSELGYKSNNN
jgi:hypothetical protein